jgi:hypothetical protein
MKINSARLFGIFFIFSFMSYAIGIGIMGDLQNSQIQPFQVLENKVSLVVGAILIAIFHTLFNLGLLVIMFNVLKSINKSLSIIYLILGSFGTLLLALGAVFLVLPVTISETLVLPPEYDHSFFEMILSLSSGGNFYSYQMGMILWGIGGLFFCSLLYHSKYVPVIFPIWGSFGYLIFIAGCGLELFGIPYGVQLSSPGGLFEIGLSIWLIVKGFNKSQVTYKLQEQL